MSTDIEDLQEQIERLSNRLDVALHKLADYQTVVAGAVRDGVYRKDEFWWHELKRLASEQAAQQSVQRTACPVCQDNRLDDEPCPVCERVG